MTVQELIDMLQDCDPDAEVRIMMQESWPFECSVFGLTTREELGSDEDECECARHPHEEECPALAEPEYEPGLSGNDVFIVEGQQERYGSKRAWDTASSC